MTIEEQIEKIKLSGDKPTLLLHCCCAPCASYVLNYLNDYFKITVFFYNPNIFPQQELEKRKEELNKLVEILNAKNPHNKILVNNVQNKSSKFLNKIKGLENEREGGGRCQVCFNLRLAKTAQNAKKNSFNFFATTLTVSPHKNAVLINEIGKKLCSEKYLQCNFKKKEGYKKSIKFSNEYDLYRQNYCGCQYSRN